MLVNPAHGGLEALTTGLRHEERLLRRVLREAHLLELLNQILLDVAADGLALVLFGRLVHHLGVLLGLESLRSGQRRIYHQIVN